MNKGTMQQLWDILDAWNPSREELAAQDEWHKAAEEVRQAYEQIEWNDTYERFVETFNVYLNAQKAEHIAFQKYTDTATLCVRPVNDRQFQIALR